MKSATMLLASVLLAGCSTPPRTTIAEDLQGMWQLTWALAAMRFLTCPHCGKRPATGLHRFLPLTEFVPETFVCNLCGGRSEFSPSSERWSIAAGVFALVAVLLALRLAMTSLETAYIPMSMLGVVGFFIALIFTYQIPAAFVLRAKATLLALEPDGR